MALDYSAMTREELEAEIEREQTELNRLMSEISTQYAYLEIVLLPELERLRGRLRYWREQRRLVRAEVRRLRRLLSSVLGRIRELENRLRGREVLIFPSVVDRAEMVSLRESIREGWTEWANVMVEIRGIKPRQREADARYRRELRGYRRLRQQAKTTREELRENERKRKAEEEEIEKKKKFLVKYVVWEFTKYYEVIIKRVGKTPPVRFELRGEFTLPAHVTPESKKVRDYVELKFDEAIVTWSEMRRTPVDFATARELIDRGETVIVERGTHYWLQIMAVATIDLRNFRTMMRSGAEKVGESDEFKDVVTVTIVKYVDEDRIGGPWYQDVKVEESELTE